MPQRNEVIRSDLDLGSSNSRHFGQTITATGKSRAKDQRNPISKDTSQGQEEHYGIGFLTLVIETPVLTGQVNRRIVQKLYGLWFLVSVIDTGTKEGQHSAPGAVTKGVQETHVISVIEGHLPLITIQEHPYPLGRPPNLEPCPGLCACRVLVSLPQS